MKFILRTYIPADAHKFDSLEEAMEEKKHAESLQPENIYFVDGQPLYLGKRHVCKDLQFSPRRGDWRCAYLDATQLTEWLLHHKNEVLAFYLGQGEQK